MGNFNFYAIKRGFDKEKNEEVHDLITKSWNDVRPLVIGYDKSRYKGFLTEEEALKWLSIVDTKDEEKKNSKAAIENNLKGIIKQLIDSGMKPAEVIGTVAEMTIDLVMKK